MRRILAAAAALTMFPAHADAGQRPILHDAVALNIGVNCQWQSHCMSQQRSAMKHSLSYVASERPPQWRTQLCNRNASRNSCAFFASDPRQADSRITIRSVL